VLFPEADKESDKRLRRFMPKYRLTELPVVLVSIPSLAWGLATLIAIAEAISASVALSIALCVSVAASVVESCCV
jgi:hypothetical protein